MEDYAREQKNGKTAFIRGICRDEVAAALFDGTECVAAETSGGRGAVFRFPCGDGWGILRKCLRGGVLRHFNRESYFLSNRPLRELRLHDYVWRQGLPVPEPLGACWHWHGPFVRGAFATLEIPARTLFDALAAEPGRAAELMRRSGALVRRMHDLGIWHADLNVRNILATDNCLYLIDFDNARLTPKLTRVQRARNLFRFRRSLEKNRVPLDLFGPLCQGYGEESLPGWIGRIYHAKGALHDAVTRPRNGV